MPASYNNLYTEFGWPQSSLHQMHATEATIVPLPDNSIATFQFYMYFTLLPFNISTHIAFHFVATVQDPLFTLVAYTYLVAVSVVHTCNFTYYCLPTVFHYSIILL